MATPYNEVKPSQIGRSRKRVPSSRKPTNSSRVDGRPASKTEGSNNGYRSPGSNSDNTLITSSTSTSPSSTASDNVSQWPKSLQQFVSDSFLRSNSLLSENEKGEFNKQLQEIIERAFAKGLLWTNDWKQQKIPILDKVPLQLFSEVPEVIQNVKEENHKSVIEPTSSTILPSKRLDYPVLSESPVSDYDSRQRKKQRLERFETPPPSVVPSKPQSAATNKVVGQCQDLEKNYLRLTSEPDPAKVRPQAVLEKSLKYVLSKYSENKTYSYIINQLKSIRQDLTVQHIKNDFTVYVYEFNARTSLENGDLGEFNQCQSQLKYLYYLKRERDVKLKTRFFRWEAELLVYRVIYMLITNNHSELSKLKYSILHTYQNFIKTDKEKAIFKFIDIIFSFHSDILLGNYHHFFKTLRDYKETADLALATKLVKNSLYEKTRIKALQTMVNSYKKISVEFLSEELNFETVQSFKEFLTKNSLATFLVNNEKEYECLSSKAAIQAIVNKPNFNKVDIKGQI
ncbi:hypothetical protein DFJ63DRAFT_314578 [Scheffersomyces coipomensis]|uniref:uncharacterized protein n=1 Tax=Scheffersomyces coipomensis TaxID=1788519 RepID=UPI00315C53DA